METLSFLLADTAIDPTCRSSIGFMLAYPTDPGSDRMGFSADMNFLIDLARNLFQLKFSLTLPTFWFDIQCIFFLYFDCLGSTLPPRELSIGPLSLMIFMLSQRDMVSSHSLSSKDMSDVDTADQFIRSFSVVSDSIDSLLW